MADMTIADLVNPAPRAEVARRAGVIFNTWEHVVDEGVDWRAALTRDYWTRGGVVDRFRPGDTVIIHSSDHFIQFRALVLDVNTAADPVYLNLAFQAIYPTDLELPEPELQLPPRYVVRQAPASSAFFVIDMTTGKRTHDNAVERHRGQEMASELNRALNASHEQLASNFARHRAAAESVSDRREKARERSRRWREQQRAAAETAAAATQDEAAA